MELTGIVDVVSKEQGEGKKRRHGIKFEGNEDWFTWFLNNGPPPEKGDSIKISYTETEDKRFRTIQNWKEVKEEKNGRDRNLSFIQSYTKDILCAAINAHPQSFESFSSQDLIKIWVSMVEFANKQFEAGYVENPSDDDIPF